MKIFIGSDTHVDAQTALFVEQEPVPITLSVLGVDIDDYDVFILCGDLTTEGAASMEMVLPLFDELNSAGKKVFFLLGNHDYYGMVHGEAYDEWEDFLQVNCLDNVTLLHPGNLSVKLKDHVYLLGTTLWTDHGGGDPIKGKTIDRTLPDRQNITWNPDTGALWGYKSAREVHAMELDALRQEALRIRSKDPEAVILIASHHAPSVLSIQMKYLYGDPRTRALNHAFYTDLEAFISEIKPKYWFHGHIHNRRMYSLGGGSTVVLANPFGYHDPDYSEDTRFNPLECIEV